MPSYVFDVIRSLIKSILFSDVLIRRKSWWIRRFEFWKLLIYWKFARLEEWRLLENQKLLRKITFYHQSLVAFNLTDSLERFVHANGALSVDVLVNGHSFNGSISVEFHVDLSIELWLLGKRGSPSAGGYLRFGHLGDVHFWLVSPGRVGPWLIVVNDFGDVDVRGHVAWVEGYLRGEVTHHWGKLGKLHRLCHWDHVWVRHGHGVDPGLLRIRKKVIYCTRSGVSSTPYRGSHGTVNHWTVTVDLLSVEWLWHLFHQGWFLDPSGWTNVTRNHCLGLNQLSWGNYLGIVLTRHQSVVLYERSNWLLGYSVVDSQGVSELTTHKRGWMGLKHWSMVSFDRFDTPCLTVFRNWTDEVQVGSRFCRGFNT